MKKLKPGDKIDAIKTERAGSERIEAWAIAVIDRIEGNYLVCSFCNDPQEQENKFNNNSNEIAPLGTMTGDWSWRDKLAVNDFVDIVDTQGKWHLGTVLKVIEGDIKKLTIGLRFYCEGGGRVDEKGQFEGWNSAYDTTLSAYSIKIQK